MEISTQHADLADIMTCQTRVALEKILKREAQGVRLSYTLIIRGEPKLPDPWRKEDGWKCLKDPIREITILQPGKVNVEGGIVYVTMRLLEDALTVYGFLDGTYWDRYHLRVEIWLHVGTQIRRLLSPIDERRGPRIDITSGNARHTRLKSTSTRCPPSDAFRFQSGMPTRTRVIEMPGLWRGINPEEHVWNRLSRLSDEICPTFMFPMVPGMSEPLGAYGTSPTTSNESSRRLSMSTNSSPPTSICQSTPYLSASPIGVVQAHRRTESCSSSPTMSSSGSHRPIIDGSLKGLK